MSSGPLVLLVEPLLLTVLVLYLGTNTPCYAHLACVSSDRHFSQLWITFPEFDVSMTLKQKWSIKLDKCVLNYTLRQQINMLLFNEMILILIIYFACGVTLLCVSTYSKSVVLSLMWLTYFTSNFSLSVEYPVVNYLKHSQRRWRDCIQLYK